MKKLIIIILLVILIPSVAYSQNLSIGLGKTILRRSISVLSLKSEFPSDPIIYPFVEFIQFVETDEYYYSVGLSYCSVLKFSLAAGYYEGKADGLNLGNSIEFHSAAELVLVVSDQYEAGISLSHISNAGLNNRNPGTEILRFIIYF
jgi:hypothetical protein